MELVKHHNWKDMCMLAINDKNGRRNTPMRDLIIEYPGIINKSFTVRIIIYAKTVTTFPAYCIV